MDALVKMSFATSGDGSTAHASTAPVSATVLAERCASASVSHAHSSVFWSLCIDGASETAITDTRRAESSFGTCVRSASAESSPGLASACTAATAAACRPRTARNAGLSGAAASKPPARTERAQHVAHDAMVRSSSESPATVAAPTAANLPRLQKPLKRPTAAPRRRPSTTSAAYAHAAASCPPWSNPAPKSATLESAPLFDRLVVDMNTLSGAMARTPSAQTNLRPALSPSRPPHRAPTMSAVATAMPASPPAADSRTAPLAAAAAAAAHTARSAPLPASARFIAARV
mmetsp:Transcript_1405/g.5191  ORF Transcript_1405/g.5191 Transcript_1405/m.5191 type:complete len:289 (-) Transcript_1405:62-928(-)